VSSPPESTPVGQILRPLRDLASYALVGATGIWLLVAIIDLIPDGSDQFGGRTEASFGNFVNLPIVAFPILAVLLALLVPPRHPKARLIVLVALIEYAVAAFFGLFFGLLIGLINLAADAGARAAFEGLLTRLAWLAVLAVAAYGVFLIWQKLYTTPKPAPGVYGQQPPFNPGAFPGQPGYGPPPPGHPGPPPPPGGFGPTTYGQPAPQGNAPQFQGAPPFQTAPPQSPPPFQGAPQSSAPPFQSAPQSSTPPFQSAPPSSAPPFQSAPQTSAPPFQTASPQSGAPTVPNPSWNQPAVPMQPSGSPSAPPFSEPTQAVPRHPGDDRTEKIDEPRPGFGPAEPDPPRS
jgi:hypothetical protein